MFANSKLLDQLKSVRWSPYNGASVILTHAGFQHDFADVDRSADIKVIAPHHVKQIHSNIILKATAESSFQNERRPEGDGIFSLEKGVKIAIKTADCLPILVATKNKTFAAAVHAGWRGFTSGILARAITMANQYDTPENILVVTGPAISRDQFEVGEDVVAAVFSDQAGLTQESQMLVTSKGQLDRWHVDLPLASACVAIHLGILPANIEIIQSCTKAALSQGKNLHNSYRRDGKGCGSNWSWISIS
jgi:YfiH family protein